jgi:hypothetical protein
VTTITFFMGYLLLSGWLSPKAEPDLIAGESSDHASVGAKHLAVDPGAVGTSEERHGSRDVLRRTKAFQRIHLRKALDDLL